MSHEQKQKYKENKNNKMTDEQKQKIKDYQREYKRNTSEEQKQRYKEKIIITIINMVAYYLLKHVMTKSSAKHVDRLL